MFLRLYQVVFQNCSHFDRKSFLGEQQNLIFEFSKRSFLKMARPKVLLLYLLPKIASKRKRVELFLFQKTTKMTESESQAKESQEEALKDAPEREEEPASQDSQGSETTKEIVDKVANLGKTPYPRAG